MIKLNSIYKSYGRTILNNINLTFNENNIYLLKGISGCGKTTLLNIIGGIDKEFDGEYLIDNINIYSLSKKEQKSYFSNVSYIFQESLLVSHLTIFENLLFICNEREKIIELAKKFNVIHLLNKMPNQISGGERQRISVIRSLLDDPKIIIADEPTASLDHKNALELCSMFNLLKDENKILIIATHDNIFDNIADCIIDIDYGNTVIKKNNIKDAKFNNSLLNKKAKENRKMNFIYSFRRFTNNFKIGSLIAMSLIIFLILSALSLKLNFKQAYIEYMNNKYPFETVYINKNVHLNLLNKNEITIYNNYNFTENNIDYLTLLPEGETILSNNEYIYDGRFPVSTNEVLVNDKYFSNHYNYDTLNGTEKLSIRNKDYNIVGIITKDRNLLNDIYSTNSYYSDDLNDKVFIPYDSIKEISDVIDSDSLMVTIHNLYKNETMNNQLLSFGFVNCWNNKIESITYSLSLFTDLFFAALFVLSIISFIFIANQIILSLHYRKREIGYLQLFGVKKSRISKLIIYEYFYKYIFSIIISLVIFIIFCILLSISMNINMFIPIKYLLVLLALIMLYCYLIIIIPLRIYVSKSIKQLIYD